MRFTQEWLIDALERVVLAGLVAGATQFLVAPHLDTETARTVVQAAVVGAVMLAKTIITNALNGTASAVGVQYRRIRGVRAKG